MAIKEVKVKHMKGGERLKAWWGREFTATAFRFRQGGEVIIYDENMDEVGTWHLEQYVEVLNEN
ncbi:TPA: hypothetical protein IB961_002588 [Escherichia coli]|nr:hypothetical protein [Escherichia coli]EHW6757509.1 hypothetical protein [Escherichia coli]EKT9112642.1 hypothetical protein [Escherichia coli]HAM7080016.1 hypothetical protein [Escherichia coli]HBB9178990.1 hypothetical protein [Escherichia coli]